MKGQTVVITGASTGIGAAAARLFAERGATVAVVGRSPEKTAQVAAQVGGRAHLVDYGSLADVRRLADELLASYERIDVLANNAGALFANRKVSVDGHEMTFQVNHLAPFLLTNLLLDRLTRVINTGSARYRKAHLDLDGAEGPYNTMRAYGAAKLATILFTRELARRTQITTAAFHPGWVATDVARENPLQRKLMNSRLARVILLSPEQGAEPLLHLATADPLTVNGAYFHRLTLEDPKNPRAHDPRLAERLWERSLDLTGLPRVQA